jgi:hypothetical protein
MNIHRTPKRIRLFSYSCYRVTHPHLMRFCGAASEQVVNIEAGLRRTGKPGAAKRRNPQLLNQEPRLKPVLQAFVAGVASIAKVRLRDVRCVRSWAFIARSHEFVFLDKKQYWISPIPSTETGLHNHLPYHFSGVFYLSVPELLQRRGPRSEGCIAFQNPIRASFSENDWHHIRPATGDLLIFDSGLWHRVIPHLGDASRLSLSMDALIAA